MNDLSNPTQFEIDEVGNLFKIIGDSTRLKLIFALINSKKTVKQLMIDTNSSQSLISHQLKILKDNYIVSCTKKGNMNFYYLIDEHINMLLEIAMIHINEKASENYEG